jgi:GAF domain-containing protein
LSARRNSGRISRRLQRSIERFRSGRVRAVQEPAPTPPPTASEHEPLDRFRERLDAASDVAAADNTLEEGRNLKRLHEVIHFLGSANEIATLIPEVLDLALSVSSLSRGLLALADPRKKTLPKEDETERTYSVRLIRGLTREERKSPEVRVLRRFLSQALESRQPAFEPDIRHAPCADEEPGSERLALGAAVVLPLEAGGKLLGALLLDDPGRSEPFRPAEVDLLKAYARHAALAVSRCLRARESERKRDRAIAERDELARKLAVKEREVEELKARSSSASLNVARDRDRLDELFERPYGRAKRSFLRRYLRDAVEKNHGDLERAARATGLSVAKLARLLALHEVPAPPRDRRGSEIGHAR